MSDQTISGAMPSATSSPASADGATPCDSQVSPMTDLFGRAVVHASPSAPQASSVATKMSATYGLRSSTSSASAALELSLASRLQALLDTPGGTMWRQTWKLQVTPQRRRISAHIQSGLHTSGSGFTGWPTAWPTPNAGPQNDGDTTWQRRRELLKAKHGNGNGFGMNLGQAATLASWATPTTRDWKDGATTLENTPVNSLLGRQVLGATSNGSNAQTEKRGQLNPAFSRWLQGYPRAWCEAAIEAWHQTPTRRAKRG